MDAGTLNVGVVRPLGDAYTSEAPLPPELGGLSEIEKWASLIPSDVGLTKTR